VVGISLAGGSFIWRIPTGFRQLVSVFLLVYLKHVSNPTVNPQGMYFGTAESEHLSLICEIGFN
jgi:hypothetical protein